MKRFKYILLSLMLFMFPVLNVLADTTTDQGEKKLVYIVGVGLFIIRIVVPVILIVIASFDLVKAMTQNDEREMKKVIMGILPKVLSAILIFLLPSLVSLLLTLTKQEDIWNDNVTCLLKPFECDVELWEDSVYSSSSSSSMEESSDKSPQPTLVVPKGTYKKVFKSKIYDRELEYYITIPKDFTENMPLIVSLHGDRIYSSGNLINEDKPFIHKYVKEIYGDNAPFVYIQPYRDKFISADPSLPERTWNEGKDHTLAVTIELIKSVIEEYKIDKNRVNLNGHSNGAVFAIKMFSRNDVPLFSSLVLISGIADYNESTLSNIKKIPAIRAISSSDSSDDWNRNGLDYLCKKLPQCSNIEICTTCNHGSVLGKKAFTKEMFEWMITQSR